MWSVGSSLFDPNPISFKRADELGVAPVRDVCTGSRGTRYFLETPLNRNAFLVGCLDFAGNEPVEHLIVGFGAKVGRTTKVASIAHAAGTATSVRLDEAVRDEIGSHLKSDYRAEVIVFHNHPHNALNVLFDNVPWASDADRRTALIHWLEPFNAIKSAAGGGRVLFYLGENGYVREIRTPQLLDAFNLLARSK